MSVDCPKAPGSVRAGGVGASGPGPSPASLAGTAREAGGTSESDDTHKALLGAPTRGIPPADPPLRASKCAPTLAHVHCHSHGNSYTNGTHIGAHAQYYKHASSGIHTRKHVHFPSQMCVCTAIASTPTDALNCTRTRTSVHSPTYTQETKHETVPCALNPHVHVHKHVPPPFLFHTPSSSPPLMICSTLSPKS